MRLSPWPGNGGLGERQVRRRPLCACSPLRDAIVRGNSAVVQLERVQTLRETIGGLRRWRVNNSPRLSEVLVEIRGQQRLKLAALQRPGFWYVSLAEPQWSIFGSHSVCLAGIDPCTAALSSKVQGRWAWRIHQFACRRARSSRPQTCKEHLQHLGFHCTVCGLSYETHSTLNIAMSLISSF